MYKRGRAPDPNFDSNEPLYRRFTKYSADREGEHYLLQPVALEFPWSCVNRAGPSYSDHGGDYGQYDDVLRPDCLHWGVAMHRVCDVPRDAKAEDGREYQIRLAHKPDEENYAHCEFTSHLGDSEERSAPPRTLRKKIRVDLSWKLVILKEAA
jgi:hypothetical protein